IRSAPGEKLVWQKQLGHCSGPGNGLHSAKRPISQGKWQLIRARGELRGVTKIAVIARHRRHRNRRFRGEAQGSPSRVRKKGNADVRGPSTSLRISAAGSDAR